MLSTGPILMISFSQKLCYEKNRTVFSSKDSYKMLDNKHCNKWIYRYYITLSTYILYLY